MLVSYLLLLFTHLLIPAGLLLWLALRTPASKFDWSIKLLIVTCYVAWLYFAGRWDLLSYYARYLLLALFAVAAWASFAASRSLPTYVSQGFLWWAGLGGHLLVLALFAGFLVSTLRGRICREPSLNLDYPLKGDTYYVAHGGSSVALNYHRAIPPQMFALDIVALNGLGRRAAGIHPRELDQYVIYGDTVYSPCDGEVVIVVDGLPDQTPPGRDPAQLAGNHLWIRHDDGAYVVLAHLMKGSVLVKQGERVGRGQPVARVGNSGNTTEPHLHIHAARFNGPVAPDTAFLLRNGVAVPLRFDGRFLTRNSTFRPAATP